MLAQRGVQPIPHGLRCAATLEGMPEPRRAAGRLGRRFEMVRCEYAAPAFVIAGLDTEKSAQGAHELQGQVASFPCFGPVSPCYRGAANRPDGRRAAPVSCVPLVAYGQITGAGLCPVSCFYPVIYRDLQASRREPHWTSPLG